MYYSQRSVLVFIIVILFFALNVAYALPVEELVYVAAQMQEAGKAKKQVSWNKQAQWWRKGRAGGCVELKEANNWRPDEILEDSDDSDYEEYDTYFNEVMADQELSLREYARGTEIMALASIVGILYTWYWWQG
jgi:hypothetical protein